MSLFLSFSWISQISLHPRDSEFLFSFQSLHRGISKIFPPTSLVGRMPDRSWDRTMVFALFSYNGEHRSTSTIFFFIIRYKVHGVSVMKKFLFFPFSVGRPLFVSLSFSLFLNFELIIVIFFLIFLNEYSFGFFFFTNDNRHITMAPLY